MTTTSSASIEFGYDVLVLTYFILYFLNRYEEILNYRCGGSWLLPNVPATLSVCWHVLWKQSQNGDVLKWFCLCTTTDHGFPALCQRWPFNSSLYSCYKFSPSRAMTSTLLLHFVSFGSASSISLVMTMQLLKHHSPLSSHIDQAETWAETWNFVSSTCTVTASRDNGYDMKASKAQWSLLLKLDVISTYMVGVKAGFLSGLGFLNFLFLELFIKIF